MRIVFIGSVEFSESLLRHILGMKVSVVGVCTLDNPQPNSDQRDLAPIAVEHGIPMHYVSDINSEETVSWIKSRNADVIFCFGWSRLIKKEILGCTPQGVLGYHPTLLPNNRGRHPIVWSLVLGLKQTGSTFFFMNEEADAGDIVSQVEIVIDYKDDARSLYDKLVFVAKGQMTELVPRLKSGDVRRLKQDELRSNHWRKRTTDDGLIDWSLPAESIRNLVRGLTAPYVGAHFLFNHEPIRVWRCEVVESNSHLAVPGQILEPYSGMVRVKAGLNSIAIVTSTPDFYPKIGTVL